MILGDLLDELRHNLLRDDSDQIAGPSDQLWSDATLVRYIDQAQKRFARQSLILRDGTTSAVTQLTLQTDVDEYKCHAAVISVISARLEDERFDMQRISHGTLQNYQPPDPLFFDVNAQPAQSGKPLTFYTDEEIDADNSSVVQLVSLRVYPKPSATYNGKKLYLRVCRLPLTDLTTGNLSAIPEIPEQWQFDMLYWAAARALDVMDRDAGDPGRSDRYMAKFTKAVEEAKIEARRKLSEEPRWGFGRNGWKWGR